MFVRNCWYVAAWDYELPKGELIARTIINEPLTLYRASDGRIVCLEDRCCHRFAPLSKGRLEGDDLRCMYHGLKFNREGVCIEIPGQDAIPKTARVRTFPVAERHNWIWVWMGDPAAADESLVPPAVGLDDPNWTLRSGRLDFEASYLLINDNQTDFTHLSYVHANSLGATEAFARTRPNVERLDRGVRIWRWIENHANPDVKAAHRPQDAELWVTYDVLAPSVFLMRTVTCPFGTAQRFDRGQPDFSPTDIIADSFTCQAATPVSERASRFYFSWGPRRAEGSEAVADAMLELAHRTFGEDQAIVEAQQRVIDFDPDRKQLLTSADVGPTQMRAVIRELIEAESGSARAAKAAG